MTNVYINNRFGKDGYFEFHFSENTEIINENPELLKTSVDNISELCRLTFRLKDEHIVKLFLKQISEDINIPVTYI